MNVLQRLGAAKAPPRLLVAIYKRVSTTDQAEDGYSLDMQERVLRAYCADHEYEVYDIYEDDGKSGKDIAHRPDMKRLLRDADAGRYDIILVWALSRLTRSVSDLYNTWERISKRGVGLVSYTESFDTGTSTGRAMMGLLGVFAQMEREITAERVAAAMQERALKGLRTCVYVLGYDAIPGAGLAINRREADAVESIYAHYLDAGEFTAVSAWCNGKGYHGKRGRPLSPESVHKILTRPIYCGYYSYKGKPIKPAENCSVPPIINRDTYNQVQRIIASNKAGRLRKHQLVYL